MLTLEKAKLFLRVDGDEENTLIQSLINSAVEYIETATGLDAESQKDVELCDTLQSFLIMQWYNRDGEEQAGDAVIDSLTKSIKAKAATTQ